MSCEKQPLLISYEPREKASLIKAIYSRLPNLEIMSSFGSFTEENLLGGLAPDEDGNMKFQLSGIGYYLKKK
jgi:hypothetical protein